MNLRFQKIGILVILNDGMYASFQSDYILWTSLKSNIWVMLLSLWSNLTIASLKDCGRLFDDVVWLRIDLK